MSNVFGNYIKEARKWQSKSLREVSFEVGVSHSQVSKIEKGEVRPDEPTVTSLAKALGLDEDEALILAGYIPRTDRYDNEEDEDYDDFKRSLALGSLLNTVCPKVNSTVLELKEVYQEIDLMKKFHDALTTEEMSIVYEVSLALNLLQQSADNLLTLRRKSYSGRDPFNS
ncbi:helix-turn-helix domain-containing protein [Paenibacillus sp. FSL H8-0259]|uniref:helix-turn-helix domain-containing protein n=1 Tax=Paenibacillus sp. FSL H8-0259 TaxID=1920423 RepID=UPI00096DA264|nr:helix-turn-helix transcriptional regulator [Paenibacillus sp. FSL H8-0259]OMF21862.1 hypothetical protein BK132_31505 [Paenibacillus sp. FSL H8-0259]